MCLTSNQTSLDIRQNLAVELERAKDRSVANAFKAARKSDREKKARATAKERAEITRRLGPDAAQAAISGRRQFGHDAFLAAEQAVRQAWQPI